MISANFKPHLLMPYKDERPAAYADRVGHSLAAFTAPEHKKRFGQYLTPLGIADFMARICTLSTSPVRVLDPGAGVGILSCALFEALAKRRTDSLEIQLDAYEHDAQLLFYLESCLEYARQWLLTRGIRLKYKIYPEDFVLRHAQTLDNPPRLFPAEDTERSKYDVVISNPPYFKIPKSDPRAQAAAAVVHGQPNIYALFMAVSASLLKPGGELIFIVPRSFAAGPYFYLFRERFFAMMQPKAIHLFGSRSDAFGRDEILQENIILLTRRADGWFTLPDEGKVEISFSEGVRDLQARRVRSLTTSEVLDVRTRDKILRIPVALEDEDISRLVRSWTGSLHAYGMDISTGPVVPFRAVAALSKSGEVPGTHAPLLWMQNIIPMGVKWPVNIKDKEQYIEINERSLPLLVPNRNYILMRRFSAKEAARRLIAAPLLAGDLGSSLIGLENHLNYVHRRGGSLSEEEIYGLAALFNSSVIDTYFRTFSGNTQVSATEIRAMPLPSLELIKEIGKRVMLFKQDAEKIEAVVADLIPIDSHPNPRNANA